MERNFNLYLSGIHVNKKTKPNVSNHADTEQLWAISTYPCHTWDLSNEVLYDPVPQGVSKIWQVKVEKSKST